jgi:presenilin-like A22 family membrane protease
MIQERIVIDFRRDEFFTLRLIKQREFFMSIFNMILLAIGVAAVIGITVAIIAIKMTDK